MVRSVAIGEGCCAKAKVLKRSDTAGEKIVQLPPYRRHDPRLVALAQGAELFMQIIQLRELGGDPVLSCNG